jgi:pimeloyl-ACP methyl ester carboxylesterase
MVPHMFSRAAWFAALLFLAAMPAAAYAEPISQETWSDLKQSVDLPNGQSIAVVELGEESNPPLVLLHGYSDNSRSWSLVADQLSQSFRLIAVDLRGHGKSAAPDCCYTLSDMAHDVKLVMDHYGIERASLVGHSLGSMVAQVFAQQYPDRLNKLVLVSTALSATDLAAPGGWLWDNVSALEDPIDPNSQFMLDWYANPNPVDEEFLTRERTESAAMPVKAWKGVLSELATSEYGKLTSRIEAPTLVIWGGKDGFFDADSQKAVRAALPESDYREFPDLGHNLFREEPDLLAETISDFLQ